METAEGEKTREFAFLLIERFSMIAFASAIEPLRVANRMARKPLYSWRVVTEDGVSATCSNGTRVMADCGFVDVDRDAMIIVCSGVGVNRTTTRGVLTWLRKQARRGVSIGAVCTGAHVLAKAGLLDGVRCTIHWENRESFREEFPDIELSNRFFERDGARWTSSGGAASADMMMQMINEEQGRELAAMVVDQLALAPLRSPMDEQRLSVPARMGVRHPKLTTVIHRMEENIEEPISPVVLAAEVGMSTRQLERLFRRYLNRSPKRYYMELRLQRARNLLLQTDMSVINVALASGFTSPSHFSKCYRAHFDRTPYRERGVSASTATTT
ncbi:GlxA family transcriptional regulator [Pikeienuella piscinae]|uniref:GlxA family transcriptional regulator n=1 Tax=Pikeienuella piscinae TaxID=2748098 RepID=A0A7M3T6N9_9RHOB|nr:GlxA family transcriptional regulator [Pikeienuella piscinae]QIE57670.1 GlxA family transcriptional regulator [Pikeienuella piscinae]